MIDLSTLELNPAITIAIGVIAAAILLPKLFASNPIANLPFFGLEHGGPLQREKYFLRHGRELYQQGYKKFRNSLYRLTTADGVVYYGIGRACG